MVVWGGGGGKRGVMGCLFKGGGKFCGVGGLGGSFGGWLFEGGSFGGGCLREGVLEVAV